MAENGDKSVSPQGLVQAVASVEQGRGPAPVHLWNPPYCGEMDLVIRADGTWVHEGSPIGRPNMVRLFARILKREGDRFYLVSPVEKVGIRVEDAPFLAIDLEAGPDALTFVTNMGERVTAGPGHAIVVRGTSEEPRPYLHVRAGLEALIDRKTFYRLAEEAEVGADGRAAVRSQGRAFALEA